MMYSTEIAYQSAGQIKSMQENKLQELLSYLSQHSPFYQELFKRHSVDLHSVQKLEDLGKLPVTTKEDLQRRNEDFLCVGKNKIIEYSSTSGTLGSPVTVSLTENDLNRWLIMNILLFYAPVVLPRISTS